MRYIGIIPADRLPSSSIGLRAMEFERMRFARTIAYTSSRATIVRQYHGVEVARSFDELKKLVEKEPDGTVAFVNGYSKIDQDTVKVIGAPGRNEIRCIAGRLFINGTPLGDKSLLKVMEYDRRRNVSRYMKGDSGDIEVSVADLRGPVAMDIQCLRTLLSSDKDWTRTTGEFKDTIDSTGVTVLCMDPIRHGIKWHPGLISGEKKPTSVIVQNGTGYSNGIGAAANVAQRYDLYKPAGQAAATFTRDPQRLENMPALSVIFQTHNRTATACFCLDSLCKNLKYSGRVHYCICDDRSERGHIAALMKVFHGNGVSDYSVHVATKKRWGLGASLNNGLDWSFKFTDCVLTTEDDFLLRKEFDISPYVSELMKPDVAGIKLAANAERFNPVVKCNHAGFSKVTANRRIPRQQWYTFNNLVMLRNKRVFDEIGYYVENRSPETMEIDALVRFNARTDAGLDDSLKILWPDRLRLNTYDTEWFLHIGKSTMGHTSGTETQKGYEWLSDKSADDRLRNDGMEWIRRAIHIVIPCYNNPDLLDRCLSSIASQTQAANVFTTVVDDVSSAETSCRISEVVAKYPYVVLMPLHDKGMAGGARNHALEHSPVESPYTMFMDSDDELSSPSSVESIINGIQKKGFPDVLCFGYVDSSGKPHMQHATAENMDMFIAPWSRCTSTQKVQPFTEGRRVCNDTMQYLRTVDSVDTVETIPETPIRYRSDNPDSGWHNKSVLRSKEAMDSMSLVMNDIISEKFEREVTYEKAIKAFNYIRRMYAECLDAHVRSHKK